MLRRLLMVVWLLLSTVSCSHGQSKINKIVTDTHDTIAIVDIGFQDVIHEYSPPEIYDTWMLETMQCSGLSISQTAQHRLHFYSVNAHSFTVKGAEEYSKKYGYFAGYTVAWENRIYVVLDRVLTEETVKHEMLHYILYQHGAQGHPLLYFVDRCHLSPR